MEPIASKTISTLNKNDGFTLIEVVVSMVIVLVGLLGLVQAMGVATSYNLKNQFRDEAVLIGEEQMADLFRLPEAAQIPFDSMSAASRIRGDRNMYGIIRSAKKVGSTSSYRLTVNVNWTHKQVPYQYEVQTMRTY
uniref:Prepilin-type N-terminal cleavage/methylation domain-containing protein n=1 Tax=Geobacter sp. (strain M21) TaxID=443144 RepID=C6E165_GEOSM